MSQKKSKSERKKAKEEAEAAKKPVGQIVINVYRNGEVTVHNFPENAAICVELMLKAVAVTTMHHIQLAERAKTPPPPPPDACPECGQNNGHRAFCVHYIKEGE